MKLVKRIPMDAFEEELYLNALVEQLSDKWPGVTVTFGSQRNGNFDMTLERENQLGVDDLSAAPDPFKMTKIKAIAVLAEDVEAEEGESRIRAVWKQAGAVDSQFEELEDDESSVSSINIDPAEALSLNDAAEQFNLKASTLRQAILRGYLPGQKIGRDWVVRAADVQAYASTPRNGAGQMRGPVSRFPRSFGRRPSTLPGSYRRGNLGVS